MALILMILLSVTLKKWCSFDAQCMLTFLSVEPLIHACHRNMNRQDKSDTHLDKMLVLSFFKYEQSMPTVNLLTETTTDTLKFPNCSLILQLPCTSCHAPPPPQKKSTVEPRYKEVGYNKTLL